MRQVHRSLFPWGNPDRMRTAHTQAYDSGRVYDAGPVCEASDPYPAEAGAVDMMPVSVLSAVVALLLSLPRKTRDVVCMRHKGVKYAEIAAALGTTVAAAELRHRRAMKKWPELQALFPLKSAKQAFRRGVAAPKVGEDGSCGRGDRKAASSRRNPNRFSSFATHTSPHTKPKKFGPSIEMGQKL